MLRPRPGPSRQDMRALHCGLTGRTSVKRTEPSPTGELSCLIAAFHPRANPNAEGTSAITTAVARKPAAPQSWHQRDWRAAPPPAYWLPQAFHDRTSPVDTPGLHPPQASLLDYRYHAPELTSPAQLPPRTRNAQASEIRVDTPFCPGFIARLEDTYSATTPIPISSVPPHDLSLVDTLAPGPLHSPHLCLMTSPDRPDLRTPPRSPQAAGINGAHSRKRSHSIMAGDAPPHLQSAGSRAGSVASMQQHSGDEDSPVTRTFKRTGPPPMNADNKYICDVAGECRDLVFDRKCEWG